MNGQTNLRLINKMLYDCNHNISTLFILILRIIQPQKSISMNINKDLLDYIDSILLRNNETVSVVELVTGDMLANAFQNLENADKVFKGGMQQFDLEKKADLLELPADKLKYLKFASNALVSKMAKNVGMLFNSDWGIATIGCTSPLEESDHKVFVIFAFAFQGEVVFIKKLEQLPFKTCEDAQGYYTKFILGCFVTELNQKQILLHS